MAVTDGRVGRFATEMFPAALGSLAARRLDP
jgi:hypothetical protein